jgi:hypothetical protein
MKKCLVTESLVNSVEWYSTAPEAIIKPERGGDGKMTWKDKAWIDLKAMLNRERGVFSKEAQWGVNFERKVYTMADIVPRVGGSEKFNQVCDELMGFKFGQKGKGQLTVDGEDCLLYCKYDAIKLPIVKDLKTTGNYKKGKYLNGFQHLQYCTVSKADRFEYLIVEWEEYPVIKAVHKEVFEVRNHQLLEEQVTEIISGTFMQLKALGLWEAYRNTYCLY